MLIRPMKSHRHTGAPTLSLSLLAGALILGMAAAGSRTAAAGPPKEVGLWYDDSGNGAVEILPCADRLCGRIVWLQEPLNSEGLPKMDRYNPKPENRNNPICGMQILGGLQRMGEGSWDSGWIYDPKQGAAFDLALQMVSEDQLQITGYKGIKLLSKVFLWTRAPQDLPRCDAAGDQQTEAAPETKPTAKKPEKAAKKAAVGEPVQSSAGAAPQPQPTKKKPPVPAVE